jgi:hypothetical protein
MPGVGLGSYYRMVWARAGRDTAAFLLRQGIPLGLVVAVLTIAVTWFESAGVGERFNPRIPVYAAIVATVVVALAIFVCNLVATPWRLHAELATRLRAFERRPDVDHLVQLHERGVQLLNRPVQIKERAYHDLSKQELSAYLAADNQELLTYKWKLRQWKEETAAELEKCATRSELLLFRVPGSEVPSFDFLGLITVKEFPGVTAVLNHDKAILSERLEKLLAVIRRIETGAG